jgi:hypothetical protein
MKRLFLQTEMCIHKRYFPTTYMLSFFSKQRGLPFSQFHTCKLSLALRKSEEVKKLQWMGSHTSIYNFLLHSVSRSVVLEQDHHRFVREFVQYKPFSANESKCLQLLPSVSPTLQSII